MKFAQTAKRVFLFMAVNILVVLTISLVVNLLGIRPYLGQGYGPLLIFCFVWGMGGAFVSLALSRFMAKMFMGVRVIDPHTSDSDERVLVQIVFRLSDTAGLPEKPEVGIYESPEVNAFATGPTKSRALVAVSRGLLQNLRRPEIEGVLGHEIAHVANGDMVTMTLLQGVINAFVMFFARILAFALSQGGNRDGNNRGGNFFMQYLLTMVFEFVFSLLGFLVVAAFSRWREFRADAGGAHFAGREKMIGALQALKELHENPQARLLEEKNTGFQALKISSPSGMAHLLATHPPIEERIARLQQTV